jgi:DNA-binding NarL/FixJ family response regulator
MVVAGNELYREALRIALEREAGMNVVASAGDTTAAVEQADLRRPTFAAVVADVPGGAAEVCRAIREVDGARVLVLDKTSDPIALLTLLEAGADGYVGEERGLVDVADAARRVSLGETVIPEGMLGGLLHTLIRQRREDDAALARFNRLSRREQEVLGLMVDGLDHHQIATKLIMSPHTARTHIQKVLEKLGVHSRLEAARFALDHSLLERFPVESAGDE